MRLYSALIFTALMGAVRTAPAQAVPSATDDLGPTISKSHPIAISVGYLAMIGNAPPGTCGCFLLSGGSGEALVHVWKNVAAVADVSGNRTAQVPQSQQGLSLVTYMAGPRYSFHPARRLTLYGQFLVGGVHGFDSYFPRNTQQSTGAATSLAYAPSGGVEVGLKDWLSLQALKAEYLVTELPNDVSEHQHNLRIGIGVVFRFSSQRLNR
jgi:outer membrane immunogenic protein